MGVTALSGHPVMPAETNIQSNCQFLCTTLQDPKVFEKLLTPMVGRDIMKLYSSQHSSQELNSKQRVVSLRVWILRRKDGLPTVGFAEGIPLKPAVLLERPREAGQTVHHKERKGEIDMKQRHRWLIGVLVAVALAVLALIAPGKEGALAQGDIIYVDADALAGGGGTSWSDAYTDLQDALDRAGLGWQIWVAEGTYKPTDGTDRTASFQMVNGVGIYGGFVGTEESLDDRNWETNVTVLSGDIGTVGDNSDNSYHVFYHPSGLGLDSSAVLDGFTITGGNANGDYPDSEGGGMYNNGSSPTLSNCTFSENSAKYGGGMLNTTLAEPTLTGCTFSGNSAWYGAGVFNYYVSPTLTNCTFSGNSADYGGGGMSNSGNSPVLTNCTFEGNSANQGKGGGMLNGGSSPTLTGCTFVGNLAGSEGGGMYNGGSSPALTDCTFEGNSAGAGGGMANYESSSPTLTDCTFVGNTIGEYGGGAGMYNSNSSPTLTDCIFSGNSTGGEYADGGGMYNYSSSPTLTNCSFSDNWAGDGGGIFNGGSSPTLTNCTLVDNSAEYLGGGMANVWYSSPTLTNCTFWGNSADFGGGMYNDYYSSPTIARCTFESNSALDSGGGMWNSNGSSPVLTDCIFSGNTADYGGGMNNDSSSPVLTNCIFEGNSANAGNGGGMYNWNYSSPTLTNCTFAGNSAGSDGGGVFNHFYSSAELTNSILWGNSPNQIANDGSTPTVSYSDVQGGYTGTGNIDVDPLFVDAANGDLHLGPDSLCIDAGDNFAPNLPVYDFEGDARILDGDGDGTAIVDMGVDEVVYSGPTVVEIDIRPESDQNVINLGSGGVVPVAILTTDEFDASTVRPASVSFAGAAPRRWTLEDVDRDGDVDLLLNFKVRDLVELSEDSTEATLRGETFPWAGRGLIVGTDSVRIVS